MTRTDTEVGGGGAAGLLQRGLLGDKSWARSTHLQSVSRRGDITEQVGEQCLTRGPPLKHSGRGPAHLHPQLQHSIYLGPHSAVGDGTGREQPIRGVLQAGSSSGPPIYPPSQSPVRPLLAWSEGVPAKVPGIKDLGKQAADQGPKAQEAASTPGGEKTEQ